jgi:hypothetical protein
MAERSTVRIERSVSLPDIFMYPHSVRMVYVEKESQLSATLALLRIVI